MCKEGSPWSANEKAFLQCFSEEGRFPCPDRNACEEREKQNKTKGNNRSQCRLNVLIKQTDKARMILYN